MIPQQVSAVAPCDAAPSPETEAAIRQAFSEIPETMRLVAADRFDGWAKVTADEDEVVITLPSGHEFRGVPDVLRALQGVLDQILPPCAVEIKVDKYWDAVELIEGAEKSFCPSCQFPYFLIPTS